MTSRKKEHESFVKRLQHEKKQLQGEIKDLLKTTEHKTNKLQHRIKLLEKYLSMETASDETRSFLQNELKRQPTRRPPVKYAVRDSILDCLREHHSGLKKSEIVQSLKGKYGESNEGSVSTTLQHLKRAKPSMVKNENGKWFLATSPSIQDALE